MTLLPDSAARTRVESDTAATLFVEAGAGTGKTRALVHRLSALLLDDGIPIEQLAAITFTEKAAAELRDRLRVHLVSRAAEGEALADEALAGLDTAAIGTLHSFALRLLSENPLEAGIPPRVTTQQDTAEAAAVDALAGLRETRDDLADVASARERSQRVARHSLTRRSGRRPLVAMTENAGHLDLLGDDAIMAVRLAIAADPSSRVAHGASLKRFAGLIERLAEDPASRSARQGVVDDFPAALSELGSARQCDPTVRMIRLLALDAMLYAGVEPSAAQAVIDGASDEPSVERDQDPSTTLLRRVRRSMRRGRMGP